MLKVRDIMTPSVVSFAADQTLRDAVEILVERRIGGAPVVEGDKVIGVLSVTDIIEFESVTPVEGRDESPDDESDGDADAPQEWSEGEELSSTFFTDWWPAKGPTSRSVLPRPRACGGTSCRPHGERSHDPHRVHGRSHHGSVQRGAAHVDRRGTACAGHRRGVRWSGS